MTNKVDLSSLVEDISHDIPYVTIHNTEPELNISHIPLQSILPSIIQNRKPNRLPQWGRIYIKNNPKLLGSVDKIPSRENKSFIHPGFSSNTKSEPLIQDTFLKISQSSAKHTLGRNVR